MADRSMISIHGISKYYGPYPAVSSLSLEIGGGEFFSLLGPSGCGKTTLLRMIAGFVEPTDGSIRIDGQDVTGTPPNRRPTNMVFQNYAIFPHLNVEDNVGYGLKRLRLDKTEEKRRIGEALEQVRLSALGSRKAHELSGGQRQRVALARALVMRPKVLLLDEPLSALDKKLREQMQVELRSLQQAVGITFILVTHDQYEALAMSDRIAVMFAGKLAQVATPKEIYQRPVNRQVADFLGGMNFLSATVTGDTNGKVAARTDIFGDVVLEKPPGFTAAEGKVTLGMRPERLRLLWEGETAPKEIQGTVSNRHYFGETTHLSIAVDGLSAPLSIIETNNYGADDLPIGADVRLAYDPDALVLLAE